MNRKKTAKDKRKSFYVHPYDNVDNWLSGDFQNPPWLKPQIDAFQKRINSAFGAENAMVLVWSGDRSYGDEFYTDWFSNGQPKGRPEKKPVLLFREFPINERDYVYASVPRWCLMEVSHGSQITDWEAASWVEDKNMIGGRKRIRPKIPPEFYHTHLINGVLAYHEQPVQVDSVPPCCQRLWEAKKAICYGKYRDPNDADIAMIRGIREGMDAAGVTQRNDEPRSAKLLQAANLTTKHFIKRAQMQKAAAVKDFMLERPDRFFGDILKLKGSTMSNIEMERIVADALAQDDEERFATL